MTRNVFQTADPNASVRVARDIMDMHYADPMRLARWQETWWTWSAENAVWSEISDEILDGQLQEILEDAIYIDSNNAPKMWHPNDAKIAKVRNALKQLVRVPAALAPGEWLDGREELAVPCHGGYIGWDNTTINRELFGYTFRPASPLLFNTAALSVPFDEYAEVPRDWLRFLDQIFDGDQQGVDALQEWTGYLVSGRTDLQAMLQLLGPRRSGKGTYSRVLAALYGRSYGATSLDALGYRFGLQGALALPVMVLGDVRSGPIPQLAIERLLNITGEDPIRIDVKHAQGVTTKLPCRIMIMANGVLQLPDSAGALDARSIFVRTMRSFVGHEDRTLSQRLTTGESLQGILTWALFGLERLNARGGRFTVQEAAAEDRGLARELSSPMVEFLNDRYERVPGAREVGLSEFHEHYMSWRMSNTRDWRQTQKMTEAEVRALGLTVSRPKDAERKTQAWTVYDIRALVH